VAIGAFSSGALAATIDAPALTSWNLDNALTVDEALQSGRTYVYPDQLTRDSDVASDGTGSVGYVFWSLDDASGRAPGIQVVTGDTEFNLRNCIMASGERPVTGPKTCSDPQSSAKRFKMFLTEQDTPMDLVFDVGEEAIVYDDGVDLNTVEVGRIYRVLQKWSNGTGARVRNFRLEVGYGTGDDFRPADFAADDLAFELREFVDRSFFGQASQAEGREVWQPLDYATFSPSMFDDGVDPRFDEGFFDNEMAGVQPPQDVEAGDKTQYIDTGTENRDGLDGAIIEGATTPNYFDLFGYPLAFSMLPTGIYEDDDGDPATEGSLIAWWDGADWRYGQDQAFAVVPDELLADWAQRPLSEDEVLEPPRYETGLIDDLGGLNVDSFIYLGDDFDFAANPTITFRITPLTIAANTIDGTEDPLWTLPGNEAPELSSYLEADLSVSVTADRTTVKRDRNLVLTLTVSNGGPSTADNVVLSGTLPVTKFAVTAPAGCALAGAILSCSIAELAAGATQSFDVLMRAENRGTVTAEVTVTADQEDPVAADNADSIVLTVEKSGGGGCAYNPGGPVDPTLPLMLLGGIAWLLYRRRSVISAV
jgi:uncharacterized repeat protein (TIGR01451 family)